VKFDVFVLGSNGAGLYLNEANGQLSGHPVTTPDANVFRIMVYSLKFPKREKERETEREREKKRERERERERECVCVFSARARV